MSTKRLSVPFNFSYKSFGNDELDEVNYCFIHNQTIVFNQDLVDTVTVDALGTSSIFTTMELKDGSQVTKIFDVHQKTITERPSS